MATEVSAETHPGASSGSPGLQLLSGNAALAQGALDAGVSFVAAFPGGPTSSLVYALAAADRGDGVGPHVQWSLNEKVAVESAAGAAMGGVRSMVVMKHFGANNAADMIFAAPLMFVPGLVIVVGDDPHGHTSHSEQDTRPYPVAADMPCLEAASPQEAYDMARRAFELSEELGVPVYLRIVKWLSDWSATVRTATPIPARVPSWDSHHFQSRPIIGQHRRLHETLSTAPAITGRWGFDRVSGPEGPVPLGVVAAGNAYQFVVEALSRVGATGSVPVLKLSTINPLPEALVLPFLARCEEVLVVEEIEPVVQNAVAALCVRAGLSTRLSGRSGGPFEPVDELTPASVTAAVSAVIERQSPPIGAPAQSGSGAPLPDRRAAPRPGNAHRPTFYALRRFAARHPNFVFMGDVGESAAMGRPLMKAHSAMGAGIGMAVGAARSDPAALVVSVVGDGTIFGFALTGIADAVYNRARLTLLVVDNATMESTGGQPTPSSPSGLRGDEQPLDIEATLRALGVTLIEHVDPRDVAEVEAALERCAGHDGVSVVMATADVSRHDRPVVVDAAAASAHRAEIEQFGCPALGFVDASAYVDARTCVRCGDCAQVAPDAITVLDAGEPSKVVRND